MVSLPKLILNDPSILWSGNFIAVNTWDLSIVPDEHAEPLDKAIWGIKLNNCSATLPTIWILRLLGTLFSTLPLILN